MVRELGYKGGILCLFREVIHSVIFLEGPLLEVHLDTYVKVLPWFLRVMSDNCPDHEGEDQGVGQLLLNEGVSEQNYI